jgi:GT2 family glycosyltransferase
MPAYNSDRYVQEALHSLTSQTYEAIEVIVVYGGSSDGTQNIVERAAAADSRVRLERQVHTGIVDARNLGAGLARGQYLAWLDADDVAVPHRIERQVQFMDMHPNVAALGGSMLVADQKLRPILPVRYPTQPAQISATLPDANALAASTAMIRASAYKTVGGCRSAFRQGAEDYDPWLRLSESFQLANLPDFLSFYRIHPNQVSGIGVERFVLPTVAAQLSFRTRRELLSDPYGELERFTYAHFVQTGASRQTVDTLLLQATAGQAMFLALVGQASDALRLLEWAAGITSPSQVGRRTRAKISVARAVVSWRTQRPVSADQAMVGAMLLDPRHVAHMLSRGVQARVWRQDANYSMS